MTRYLTLAEYVWLAEQVTGVEAAVLVKASRIDLADSALHAPAAEFGGEEFYPDLADKAAVLTCRLAWNHPLPDGTKRARGQHWRCSSTSTTRLGTPTRPPSMIPKPRCSQWRYAKSTKLGPSPRPRRMMRAAGQLDPTRPQSWCSITSRSVQPGRAHRARRR